MTNAIRINTGGLKTFIHTNDKPTIQEIEQARINIEEGYKEYEERIEKDEEEVKRILIIIFIAFILSIISFFIIRGLLK